ncbi:hypothetical protein Dimus_014907 [Dionaea muscipula]
MGLQDMNLVLSTDAKPRLKWTPELHQRFVEAINQLGGADKATPKSLMRVMGIPGLTLYHLKSHLQKFRLGKNQQLENCTTDFKQDDEEETPSRPDVFSDQGTSDASESNQMNGSLHLAEALQMQLEVQRKLHEQIEVQRHLQLRIEAQGKYLQKVLKKAQETLTGYNSATLGVDHAKEELSKLVSMVGDSSSFSELTETIQLGGVGCSMECSSLQSPPKHSRGEKEPKHSSSRSSRAAMGNNLLNQSWMNTCPGGNGIHSNGSRKRGGGGGGIGSWEEEKSDTKRLSTCREKIGHGFREHGPPDTIIDLNSQYQNDMDLIDLNSKGIVRQFHALR